MAERNISRDVPTHGVEAPEKDPTDRSDGKSCRHDGCTGDTCRVEAAADAVQKIGSRLDSIESRSDYDEDRELAYQNKSREEQRAVTTRGQQADKAYAEQMARKLQSEGKFEQARKYWRMAGHSGF